MLSPLKELLDTTLNWNSTTFGTYAASEYFLNVFCFFLILAPRTINDADNKPVKRIPILSRITPAKIKKKQNTLRKYSEAAYVPNVVLFQLSVVSLIRWESVLQACCLHH